MSILKAHLKILSAFVVMTIAATLSCACQDSSMVDFRNEKLGYALEYPMTWTMEINAVNERGAWSYNIWAPGRLQALVVISVYDGYGGTAKEAANAVLAECNHRYEDVKVILNKETGGSWDWCLNLTYKDPHVGSLIDTCYYKKMGDRLYEIQTTGQANDYSALGLEDIVHSFRLIKK